MWNTCWKLEVSNISNNESFKLIVQTTTYKDGLITQNSGLIDDRTEYGLKKLSEALYISSSECAKRHADLALREQEGK